MCEVNTENGTSARKSEFTQSVAISANRFCSASVLPKLMSLASLKKNHRSLTQVQQRDLEIDRAPNGPPFWSEKLALLAARQPVAVNDMDPDTLSALMAREMGIYSSAAYSYDHCKATTCIWFRLY